MQATAFASIEKIEVVEYEGEVFNLKTEDETYVVEGVVVHNCPHFWMMYPIQALPGECINLWMGE